MKPTGCNCPGEEHVKITCFITPAPAPTINALLSELGLPHGDEGIRMALKALVEIDKRQEQSPPVNPWG